MVTRLSGLLRETSKEVKKMRIGLSIAVLLFANSALAQLEVGGDLLDSCDDIESLLDDGDFTAARDQARTCLEAIEQELSGSVSALFPAQVGNWTQTNLEQNQVMGFNNITAVYSNNNISVNVSLTGAAGGGTGSGLGGLGGLLGGIAQAAMAQSGQQVTVAGIPSTLNAEGALTVPLEDGSLLVFDSPNVNSADAALEGFGDLVNDFPVAAINDALQ